MKITLLGERPWSWNKMYSGIHWKERSKEAKRIHWLMFLEIRGYQPETAIEPIMFENRVDIIVTVYFKNRPYDSDNCCVKPYIDGLIGIVLKDDTRKYVRRVSTQSEIDKENPRMEIEIKEVK